MTDPTLTPELYGPDHANPLGLAVAKARADSAAKREPISGLDFVSARAHAGDIGDRCIVAYWIDARGGDITFHRTEAEKSLHRLADLFGYRLEAK
jgi:hypothetical protein